ncbi:hypothetical protein GGR56DRAFT_672172 [Xylariaceae sp. FL0804]|nr:hypothetical protein GGR56DRAFT_672172 [Xylariaceae sp. FL0804]
MGFVQWIMEETAVKVVLLVVCAALVALLAFVARKHVAKLVFRMKMMYKNIPGVVASRGREDLEAGIELEPVSLPQPPPTLAPGLARAQLDDRRRGRYFGYSVVIPGLGSAPAPAPAQARTASSRRSERSGAPSPSSSLASAIQADAAEQPRGLSPAPRAGTMFPATSNDAPGLRFEPALASSGVLPRLHYHEEEEKQQQEGLGNARRGTFGLPHSRREWDLARFLEEGTGNGTGNGNDEDNDDDNDNTINADVDADGNNYRPAWRLSYHAYLNAEGWNDDDDDDDDYDTVPV